MICISTHLRRLDGGAASREPAVPDVLICGAPADTQASEASGALIFASDEDLVDQPAARRGHSNGLLSCQKYWVETPVAVLGGSEKY